MVMPMHGIFAAAAAATPAHKKQPPSAHVFLRGHKAVEDTIAIKTDFHEPAVKPHLMASLR